MAEIEIRSMGPHAYEVAVRQDGATTMHRVTVPAALRERLGIDEGDEERLVRRSFEFLLEREPASSILSEFELDVISRYFPEFEAEIAGRLR